MRRSLIKQAPAASLMFMCVKELFVLAGTLHACVKQTRNLLWGTAATSQKNSSDRSGEAVEWQYPVFNAARPCKLPVPAVCLKESWEEMSNVSWQHSEPRGSLIQPASASRQLLRSLPGQGVNCSQMISCGAQQLLLLLQNPSSSCRSDYSFFFYYYHYILLCLCFIRWGAQNFKTREDGIKQTFLSNDNQQPLPRIRQQFTWAVSTLALESSRANAMAKAEKAICSFLSVQFGISWNTPTFACVVTG